MRILQEEAIAVAAQAVVCREGEAKGKGRKRRREMLMWATN